MKTVITIVILMLTGCSATAPSPAQPDDSLGAVVQQLVAKAEAGDLKYFTSLLGKAHGDQSPVLVDMIRRSDISENYKQRFSTRPDGSGRLNYHYLEKGCHFQVDLRKNDVGWETTRIWFCR
jgi:hypothetical protein